MQSIITDSTITLISEGAPSVIGKTHPNFYKIKKALLAKNFLEIGNLLDVKNGYKEFSNGLIAVDGDNLIYKESIIHNVLTQRICEMIHNGDEVTPMINFLVNLMDNPSEGSIDQLYTFLEHENLPITEDGCFLAYKAINRNYTDKYTGSISNKVGEKVKMPYEEVTANPEVACSSGLHCGSIEYVRCYGNFTYDENSELDGDRLITVKVNPSDVVSVPEDSNRQKVRVYRYVVHEEIENPFDVVPKYEAPVYYEDEDEDEDYDDFDSWDDDERDEEGHDDSNNVGDTGIEGEPGNPCHGLIDFDDPQRSESILAGCVRQSTENPLEKNSFDSAESEVDVEMINAMYNANAAGNFGADGKPYGKLFIRSTEKNSAEEMFQDASCYATKDTEKKSVDSAESDKSELPDPPSEINLESDDNSNEETVVKVAKTNNIILPDNN